MRHGIDGDAWDAQNLNGEASCLMHHPQHQPMGDGRPENNPSDISFHPWYQHAQNEIEELRRQLRTAIDENAQLHDDVVMWQRVAAKRSGFDDLPPLDEDYIQALRAPQHERQREVQVLVDGRPAVACFSRNRRRNPDAAYMLDHWRQFVGTVREVRSQGAGA